MLNIANSHVTVWEPEVSQWGIAQAKLSSGRAVKNKDTNEIMYHVNSYWKAAFVGKAKEKFETLENRSRIIITNGKVEYCKSLDKNGKEKVNAEGKSPYYLNVTVFDFEFEPAKGTVKANVAPTSEAEAESDLPF